MEVKGKKNVPAEKESGRRSRSSGRARKKVGGTDQVKVSQGTDWVIKDESGNILIIDTKTTNSYFFNEKTAVYMVESSYKGFKSDEVEPIIEFLDFNQKEAAEFLEVDPATISRWKRNPKHIGRLRSKNLMEIDGIIAKGVRIFGNEEALKEWLHTRNYALGDVAPITLLKDPYGVVVVNEAIEGLSWGSFV